MNLKNVIRQPIITEKSIDQTAVDEYTFVVDSRANKGQIKKAIEEFFGVNVTRVRTCKVKGKTRRAGKRRTRIKLPDWKKAIVKVKEGQKIEYFETGGGK